LGYLEGGTTCPAQPFAQCQLEGSNLVRNDDIRGQIQNRAVEQYFFDEIGRNDKKERPFWRKNWKNFSFNYSALIILQCHLSQ